MPRSPFRPRPRGITFEAHSSGMGKSVGCSKDLPGTNSERPGVMENQPQSEDCVVIVVDMSVNLPHKITTYVSSIYFL